MKNEKALGAFMAKIAEAQSLLAELQAHVDDHMGASPEEINYGHVGSVGYMVEKLAELTDWALGRGEHTQ